MDVVGAKPRRPHPWCREYEERGLIPTREQSVLSSLYRMNSNSSDHLVLREIHNNVPTAALHCQSCNDDAVEPSSKCRDCNENLCQGCVHAHRRVNVTKHHVIIPFNGAASPVSSTTSTLSNHSSDSINKENKVCGPHDPETAQFYCETCSEAVCNDCSPLEHRNHEVVQLRDATERAAITAGMLLAEARTGAAVAQNAVNAGTKKIDSVMFKSKLVEKEIRNMVNEFRLRLDEREKELLRELTTAVTVRSTSIKEEIDTFMSIRTSYTQVTLILENVLRTGKPLQILQVKGVCDRKMREIREDEECALFPDEEIVFVPPELGVLRAVSEVGKVLLTESHKNGSIGDEMKRSRSSSPSLITKALSDDWSKPASPKMPKFDTAANAVNNKINPWGDVFKFKLDFNSILDAKNDASNPTSTSGQLAAYKYHRPTPKAVSIAQKVSFNYAEAGQPKLIFGKEGNADGDLCRPWGVCCSSEGNIIVADRSNHRIQIFSPEGKFLSKFGTPGKRDPGCFDRPAGVAVDSRGRIVVTDKDNHRIQVFTKDGRFIFMFGEEGSRNGQFNYPWDVAVNSEDQIVVSDTRNHRIQLFSSDGAFLNKYGFENVSYQNKHFDSPRGVCFTTTGSVIITDFNNHRLVIIDPKFESAKFLGVEGSAAKQFLRPQGVAVDGEGNIVVADSRNNRIQVFKETGSYLCQFGSSGTEPGQFDRPSGICFTPEGKIVVVDFGNNRIQVF